MLEAKTKGVWRLFNWFQHRANNIEPTLWSRGTRNKKPDSPVQIYGQMWAHVCSTIVERTVLMASTPSNIFHNKRNVESIIVDRGESMLNESLNQFTFDSTRFQQVFYIFYPLNNVECKLKQMLKAFKWALSLR